MRLFGCNVFFLIGKNHNKYTQKACMLAAQFNAINTLRLLNAIIPITRFNKGESAHYDFMGYKYFD